MNTAALLSLIGDLYVQIQQVQAENAAQQEGQKTPADAPLEGPESASEMARGAQ
jgi:hypothetical protein